MVVGAWLPDVGLRGADGGRVWFDCERGAGLYACGDAGECGVDGGRGDAADHGDVDRGEWV